MFDGLACGDSVKLVIGDTGLGKSRYVRLGRDLFGHIT